MPNRSGNNLFRRINSNFRKFNATNNKKFPRMKNETKLFLQALFARENNGLSELIGINVHQYWPYMKESA